MKTRTEKLERTQYQVCRDQWQLVGCAQGYLRRAEPQYLGYSSTT